MFKSKGTTLERFMSHVEMVTESGCWIWMAKICVKGYGRFGLGNRPGKRLSQGTVSRSAHVVAYELIRGSVPDGLELDHLCRVRCCVNPWHLEAVTHKVNCDRGTAVIVNTARNRSKTHCPRGHEYSQENTFVTQGGRKCRACYKMFNRSAYYRRKGMLLHGGAHLPLEKGEPSFTGDIKGRA